MALDQACCLGVQNILGRYQVFFVSRIQSQIHDFRTRSQSIWNPSFSGTGNKKMAPFKTERGWPPTTPPMPRMRRVQRSFSCPHVDTLAEAPKYRYPTKYKNRRKETRPRAEQPKTSRKSEVLAELPTLQTQAAKNNPLSPPDFFCSLRNYDASAFSSMGLGRVY